MKFNEAITDRAIWAIIKRELGIDGKAAHEITRQLTKSLKDSCEAALRMDRVELRAELEAELKAKYEKREAALAKKEAAASGMTREELIKILADGIADDDGKINTSAATLLTKLEGFEAASQDITINIVSYEDAPDFYRVGKPEPIELPC
jgi:hypothetical protein